MKPGDRVRWGQGSYGTVKRVDQDPGWRTPGDRVLVQFDGSKDGFPSWHLAEQLTLVSGHDVTDEPETVDYAPGAFIEYLPLGSRLYDDDTEYVSGPTGGRKGQKVARFDLIPPDVLAELAVAYGEGARKYPPVNGKQNYMNGYPWSLSLAAMFRHLYKWILGTRRDAETGTHHLAQAMWHLATLMTFEEHDLGTDDLFRGKP